jgi:hypothetical protein
MPTERAVKARKTYNGEIPFDPFTGNMMSYPMPQWAYRDLDTGEVFPRSQFVAGRNAESVWFEPAYEFNRIFRATLQITGFGRGRSSAVVYLRVLHILDPLGGIEKGAQFSMFLSDFTEMVMGARSIDGGVLDGCWTFCKVGANYGLRWLGEWDDPIAHEDDE